MGSHQIKLTKDTDNDSVSSAFSSDGETQSYMEILASTTGQRERSRLTFPMGKHAKIHRKVPGTVPFDLWSQPQLKKHPLWTMFSWQNFLFLQLYYSF